MSVKQIKLKDDILEMTFEQVHKQFEKFIHKKSREFLNYFNGEYDEAFKIGNLGLYKAYLTYNRLDIQFMTYAVKVVTNEYLMAIRKIKKRSEISIDEVINTDSEGNTLKFTDKLADDINIEEESSNSEIYQLITLAISRLNDIESKIVKYALFNEYTQRDIAKILNLSQSYISRVQARAFVKIRKMIRDGEVNTMELREENKIILKEMEEMLNKGITTLEVRNSIRAKYEGIEKIRLNNLIARAAREYKERVEATGSKIQSEFNDGEVEKRDKVLSNEQKQNPKNTEYVPELYLIEKVLKIEGKYGTYKVENGTISVGDDSFSDLIDVEEYYSLKKEEIRNKVIELRAAFEMAHMF